MAHIHTLPGQHDHTVSIFLFKLENEPKIMLHLHKIIGSYMQFGGHVELHETPWQAAVHELSEESGYTANQIKILQPTNRLTQLTDAAVHPVAVSQSTHISGSVGDHYHTDSAYAAITHDEPSTTPGEDESEDIRLFTRSEIEALPDTQIIANVREIILYMFDSILDSWEPVSPDSFK